MLFTSTLATGQPDDSPACSSTDGLTGPSVGRFVGSQATGSRT
jgi:hypothetical protein